MSWAIYTIVKLAIFILLVCVSMLHMDKHIHIHICRINLNDEIFVILYQHSLYLCQFL